MQSSTVKLGLGLSQHPCACLASRQAELRQDAHMHAKKQTSTVAIKGLSWQAAYHSESRLSSAGRVEGGKALPAACALDACSVGLVAQGAAQLEARLQCRMPLTSKHQHDLLATVTAITDRQCRLPPFGSLFTGVQLFFDVAHSQRDAKVGTTNTVYTQSFNAERRPLVRTQQEDHTVDLTISHPVLACASTIL